MVTTAQGLQLFNQGLSTLGTGIATHNKEKRLSEAAESIRGQSAEGFKGGETGRNLAAESIRGGEIGDAAKFFADTPSVEDLQAMAVRAKMSGDPNADSMINAIIAPALALKRATAKIASRLNGEAVGGDGSVDFSMIPGEIDTKNVPLQNVLSKLDSLPPPKTDIEARAKWRSDLMKNLKGLDKVYQGQFGPESYEFITDYVESFADIHGAKDLVDESGKVIPGSGVSELKKNFIELDKSQQNVAVPYATVDRYFKTGKNKGVVMKVPKASVSTPTSGYKTADDVISAVQNGKLSSEDAHKLLVSQFGYSE